MSAKNKDPKVTKITKRDYTKYLVQVRRFAGLTVLSALAMAYIVQNAERVIVNQNVSYILAVSLVGLILFFTYKK